MIYGPHNYYDEVRTYLSASPLLGLLLTLVAFQIAVWIHRRCHGNPLTNPIMLAVIVVVGLLKLTGVEWPGPPLRGPAGSARTVHRQSTSDIPPR